MDAARALVGEGGPAGFTIAEAARRAGVSPAAPYRHFRDAEALLAEVARRGFDALAEAMAAAWNDGRPDAVTAFEAIGRAYLGFARTDFAAYATMFEARIDQGAHPELAAAAERAFGVLRDAAARASAAAPAPGRPPAMMMALHLWSMAHGVASLFGRADRARRRLPMTPEDLLEAHILLYLQGLGLAGRTSS